MGNGINGPLDPSVVHKLVKLMRENKVRRVDLLGDNVTINYRDRFGRKTEGNFGIEGSFRGAEESCISIWNDD